MKLLKRYVRTYARPEASIAQGYIKDESMGYVAEYLRGSSAAKRRVWRSEEDEGVQGEVLEGAGRKFFLTVAQRDMAHEFVIRNSSIMQPWLE